MATIKISDSVMRPTPGARPCLEILPGETSRRKFSEETESMNFFSATCGAGISGHYLIGRSRNNLLSCLDRDPDSRACGMLPH